MHACHPRSAHGPRRRTRQSGGSWPRLLASTEHGQKWPSFSRAATASTFERGACRSGRTAWTLLCTQTLCCVAPFTSLSSGHAVLLRWHNQLDPSARVSSWSAEEDATLIRKQAELGNRWNQIENPQPCARPNRQCHQESLALREPAACPFVVGSVRSRSAGPKSFRVSPSPTGCGAK